MILSDARAAVGTDRVVKKIIEAMSHPFAINGKNCSISVSIGIAVYPDHGETAEQLVKIADAAMCLAKHSGKNCYRSAEVGFSKNEIYIEALG